MTPFEHFAVGVLMGREWVPKEIGARLKLKREYTAMPHGLFTHRPTQLLSNPKLNHNASTSIIPFDAISASIHFRFQEVYSTTSLRRQLDWWWINTGISHPLVDTASPPPRLWQYPDIPPIDSRTIPSSRSLCRSTEPCRETSATLSTK